MKHPIQPLIMDKNNVLRFKENVIVRYILDNGGIDLNHIVQQEFPKEDLEQFYQLIGYSLDGFADLDATTNEVYDKALRVWKSKKENRVWTLHL